MEKVMAALPPRPLAGSLFLLLFLHFLTPASSSSASSVTSPSPNDLKALLAFKSAADAAGELISWNASDPDPCSTWYGVACSAATASPRRVVRLVLEGLSLSGSSFPALTALDQLRVLSLKGNLLSGPLPDLSPLAALKLLFLSRNAFSGPLPLAATSLPPRLYRLDLSQNNLSGPVPAAALNRLTHLLTLRLDGNRLSGHISGLDLPNLQDFNVSSNLLAGAIPRPLAGFPLSAFAGNPGLCGPPLAGCDTIVRADPSRPGSAAASPISSPAATAVISSSPSSKPGIASSSAAASVAPSAAVSERRPAERMSRVAVVALVVGDFAVLVLIAGLLFCYFWRKFSGRGASSRLHEGEKIVYSSSPYTAASHGGGGGGGVAAPGFDRGKMVFFEGTRRFELEDLLRASAEMLGKGGHGTTYKAVLDDGGAVAVKRLREVEGGGGSQHSSSGLGKREFEQHMEVLGRLRHPNLVSLRAYYSARDERLLVYDYMPNGSLFSLLHGNRGPGRTPLDWVTRVRIAAGAARGLAHIHQACRSSPKLAHGNLKSTNVLLDKSGTARVADFGLASLAGGGAAAANAARPNGYRAPELSADPRKAATSHKADVYAFGVLLLELLTGKHPSPCGPENGGGGGVALGGGAVVDLPRWVQSVVREEWTAEVFDLELMRYKDVEEELVGMLQIAMSCTAASPDQRPRMAQVVKMIEGIRSADASASPSQDSFDSVSDSPSNSDDASGCRNRQW